MAKIYEDYKDLHVATTIVYVNDSKVYADSSFETQLTTSELKDLFLKGVVIDAGSNVLSAGIRYSEADSVGSIAYVGGNGSVTTAAAVADPE